MKLTAITATYHRPEAMRLCEKYMARQTRQPNQWCILNGPEPMPEKVLALIESGRIEGDAVAFFEDDDWFRSDFLQWAHDGIASGYEMIGEGHAAYWNVKFRWGSFCNNKRHAALVQTVIHADLLESAANIIRSYRSPFWDTRLWQLDANKFLHLPRDPSERRCVGIKGFYGASGYSGEHGAFRPPETFTDPSSATLFRWIGEDAVDYLPRFYRYVANP